MPRTPEARRASVSPPSNIHPPSSPKPLPDTSSKNANESLQVQRAGCPPCAQLAAASLLEKTSCVRFGRFAQTSCFEGSAASYLLLHLGAFYRSSCRSIPAGSLRGHGSREEAGPAGVTSTGRGERRRRAGARTAQDKTGIFYLFIYFYR